MDWADDTPNLCGEIEVVNVRAIFNGRYSCVYKGRIKRTQEPVAIKVLNAIRGLGVSTMKRKVERERKAWSSLRHPNILPLYGFADDHELFWPFGAFVSPWRSRGDLGEFLAEEGETTALHIRLQLWRDVVAGVLHLHSHEPLLVHGDLKPGNVLISDNVTAQICDFGLVRVFLKEGHSGLTTASPYCGTQRYLAWELVMADDEDTTPTSASDIYAVGCIALETIFLRTPYSNKGSNLHLHMLNEMQAGKPPARRPDDLGADLDELWELMACCWDREPSSRPWASDLFMRLTKMINKHRPSSLLHSPAPGAESGLPQRGFLPQLPESSPPTGLPTDLSGVTVSTNDPEADSTLYTGSPSTAVIEVTPSSGTVPTYSASETGNLQEDASVASASSSPMDSLKVQESADTPVKVQSLPPGPRPSATITGRVGSDRFRRHDTIASPRHNRPLSRANKVLLATKDLTSQSDTHMDATPDSSLPLNGRRMHTWPAGLASSRKPADHLDPSTMIHPYVPRPTMNAPFPGANIPQPTISMNPAMGGSLRPHQRSALFLPQSPGYGDFAHFSPYPVQGNDRGAQGPRPSSINPTLANLQRLHPPREAGAPFSSLYEPSPPWRNSSQAPSQQASYQPLLTSASPALDSVQPYPATTDGGINPSLGSFTSGPQSPAPATSSRSEMPDHAKQSAEMLNPIVGRQNLSASPGFAKTSVMYSPYPSRYSPPPPASFLQYPRNHTGTDETGTDPRGLSTGIDEFIDVHLAGAKRRRKYPQPPQLSPAPSHSQRLSSTRSTQKSTRESYRHRTRASVEPSLDPPLSTYGIGDPWGVSAPPLSNSGKGMLFASPDAPITAGQPQQLSNAHAQRQTMAQQTDQQYISWMQQTAVASHNIKPGYPTPPNPGSPWPANESIIRGDTSVPKGSMLSPPPVASSTSWPQPPGAMVTSGGNTTGMPYHSAGTGDLLSHLHGGVQRRSEPNRWKLSPEPTQARLSLLQGAAQAPAERRFTPELNSGDAEGARAYSADPPAVPAFLSRSFERDIMELSPSPDSLQYYGVSAPFTTASNQSSNAFDSGHRTQHGQALTPRGSDLGPEGAREFGFPNVAVSTPVGANTNMASPQLPSFDQFFHMLTSRNTHHQSSTSHGDVHAPGWQPTPASSLWQDSESWMAKKESSSGSNAEHGSTSWEEELVALGGGVHTEHELVKEEKQASRWNRQSAFDNDIAPGEAQPQKLPMQSNPLHQSFANWEVHQQRFDTFQMQAKLALQGGNPVQMRQVLDAAIELQKKNKKERDLWFNTLQQARANGENEIHTRQLESRYRRSQNIYDRSDAMATMLDQAITNGQKQQPQQQSISTLPPWRDPEDERVSGLQLEPLIRTSHALQAAIVGSSRKRKAASIGSTPPPAQAQMDFHPPTSALPELESWSSRSNGPFDFKPSATAVPATFNAPTSMASLSPFDSYLDFSAVPIAEWTPEESSSTPMDLRNKPYSEGLHTQSAQTSGAIPSAASPRMGRPSASSPSPASHHDILFSYMGSGPTRAPAGESSVFGYASALSSIASSDKPLPQMENANTGAKSSFSEDEGMVDNLDLPTNPELFIATHGNSPEYGTPRRARFISDANGGIYDLNVHERNRVLAAELGNRTSLSGPNSFNGANTSPPGNNGDAVTMQFIEPHSAPPQPKKIYHIKGAGQGIGSQHTSVMNPSLGMSSKPRVKGDPVEERMLEYPGLYHNPHSIPARFENAPERGLPRRMAGIQSNPSLMNDTSNRISSGEMRRWSMVPESLEPPAKRDPKEQILSDNPDLTIDRRFLSQSPVIEEDMAYCSGDFDRSSSPDYHLPPRHPGSYPIGSQLSRAKGISTLRFSNVKRPARSYLDFALDPPKTKKACPLCDIMLRPDNLERHIRNRHPGHVEVLKGLEEGGLPETSGEVGGRDQPVFPVEPSGIQSSSA